MSNNSKSRRDKEQTEPTVKQTGTSKTVRYISGWVPALLGTFAFMYLALVVEVAFSAPPVVSMGLMFAPLLLTASLLKNSLKRLFFRSLIFVLLVNIILPDMVTAVFLLGEAWILRQSWVIENPRGQKFRLIATYNKVRNGVLRRFSARTAWFGRPSTQ